jgi:hypothetical protein
MGLTKGQREEAAAGIGAYATKSMTFAGGTTNDPGDFDGTGNPATLFTVTGTVLMKLFATCDTNLAGASATIAVGTALSTTGLIASTTAANIAANEIWHDATPDASIELSTIATEKIVKQNVIQTVGTANITSGVLTYHCIWKPISLDGNVVAA